MTVAMEKPMRPSARSTACRPLAALVVPVLARLLAPLLALLLAQAPAAAQGFGWFGNLFGNLPRPAPGAPAYPGYGADGYAPRSPSDQSYAKPRRHVVRRPPAEPVQRDVAKTPPKNASMFVAVFGDSLGQMLGQGLDEALVDRSDVAVTQKARSATGLVTADYFDWPKAIIDVLGGKPVDAKGEGKGGGKDAAVGSAEAKSGDGKSGEVKSAEVKSGEVKPGDVKPADPKAAKPTRERIDVAVMMIGINDHQPLTIGGKVLQPGTAEWTSAYTKRVLAIDEAFRARAIPLVWVGVPITKDDAFADAMAGLNNVYREAAAKTGATYVDTWEAFSDDNGNFAAYGPDVNGQTVRLRAADGIHFTKAGARKLAHFVEVHVRRALEGKIPLPQLPTESVEGKPDRQVATARPDVGPIRNLNEAPTTGNGTLTTLDARPVPGRPVPALPAPAPPGQPAQVAGDAVPAARADNARWSSDPRAEP